MSLNQILDKGVPSAPWVKIRSNTSKTNHLDMGTTHFVTRVEDFDSIRIGDVIYLPDYTAYYLCSIIDLKGARIQLGKASCFCGNSLEVSGLKSTGLDPNVALLTGIYTISMNNMFLDCQGGTALDLVSFDGNGTIDWQFVNFYNCHTVGKIVDFANCIFNTIGFLTSGKLTFDNISYSTGTISFTDTIFTPLANDDSLILPATFNCMRRFRVKYSAFVNLGGTSINVDNSAIIPVESLILDTVNFAGFGTFLTISYNDIRALYTNCNGIINTTELGEIVMSGNATPTVIADTAVYYEFLGTSTDTGFNQRFTRTGNKLTYNGGIEITAHAMATASMISGNNNVLKLVICKNGVPLPNTESTSTASGAGRSENIATFATFVLNTNDEFTMAVRNTSATNDITVADLHLLINS